MRSSQPMGTTILFCSMASAIVMANLTLKASRGDYKRSKLQLDLISSEGPSQLTELYYSKDINGKFYLRKILDQALVRVE